MAESAMTSLAGNAGTGTVTLNYGQNYAGAGTGVSLPCALGSASCIGVGTFSGQGPRVAKTTIRGFMSRINGSPSTVST